MLTDEEQTRVRDSIERVQQQVSAVLQTRRSTQQSIDFVDVLHENIDRAIRKESERGPEPQCRAGCSYCCSVRVEASDPEALRIAHHMQTLTQSDFSNLEKRLHANARFHQQQAAGVSARMDCAFLKDHQCTIYAVRPATCRKAHSLSVAACESGADELPQNLSLVIQSEVLIAGANAAYRSLNLPASPMELAAAVLAAMASPDAAERWYQGTPILSAASQVSPSGSGDVAS